MTTRRWVTCISLAVLAAALCAPATATAKRSDNLVVFTTSADFLAGTSTSLGLPVGLAPASSFGELRLGGVTPSWSLYSAWNGPSQGNKTYTSPTLADLNGDGPVDVVIGANNDHNLAYQNTGSPSGPVWTLNTAWNPPQITQCATPALANLDDDRDLDLMVGAQRGTLDCVRNYDAGSTAPPRRPQTWPPRHGCRPLRANSSPRPPDAMPRRG